MCFAINKEVLSYIFLLSLSNNPLLSLSDSVFPSSSQQLVRDRGWRRREALLFRKKEKKKKASVARLINEVNYDQMLSF